jgi:hypothetical protein
MLEIATDPAARAEFESPLLSNPSCEPLHKVRTGVVEGLREDTAEETENGV